jgi:hypothetical protein
MKTILNEYYTDGPATVIFRKYPGGEILALFPYMIDDRGYCSCYEHIGQHGAADYHHCIRSTKPASPEEYAELKAELEKLCEYKLRVCRRANFHAEAFPNGN